ncbi:SprB repeat-containing protein, partial [Flavobacterium sp. J27]|uniref:SprB repeat-containing protein n=1 Tax=Flavobacterium sp. J27 TaxID=2060419 RepID=UPI00197AC6E5
MKQKITLFLFIISFFSLKGNAQTQFWSDTFEDVSAPSSGVRTPENNSGLAPAPYTAYFKRTDGSDIDLTFVSDGAYSGYQGSYFWAGEDHDAVYGSGNEEQQIDFTGINISGKTNLTFKGLFAASSSGNQWENANVGAFSHTDYIIVEYSIDAAPYVRLIAFFADGVSTKQLREDTTGNDIGDGVLLTKIFNEFDKSIPATGTTLSLRLRVFSNNSNNEEWAIDNFRLFEGVSCIEPSVPTLTASSNIVCEGAAATLNITGDLNDATEWRVYTGSCGGSLIGTTNGTTFIVNPTGSGTTYYIRGEGGCTTPGTCGSITINVNPTLTASISSQTNVACNGGTNGAATVTPTGGTGPFNYSWSPSGITSATATGLAAGTYNVMVTDANNCSASTSVTITEPTTLALTASSQTDVSCNGGSNGAAAVNVATGGAGGYTYNWTPGNPTGDGTPSVTGLSAGTWTCTVTDANSCTTSVNFTITQPTALALTASSQTDVACNGGSNGAATVNVATGGAGGYT